MSISSAVAAALPESPAAPEAVLRPDEARSDARRSLLIVGGGLTPYRLHFHRRIARELPEVALTTVNTHNPMLDPWRLTEAPGLEIVHLEPSDETRRALPPPWRQWAIGGELIRLALRRRADAAIINGYNHLGHLRLLRWCARHGVPAFLWTDSNVHGDEPGWVRRAFKKRLLPKVISWSRGVMVCGRFGREFFLRYGADPAKITLCPYEPDYGLISSIPAEQVGAVAGRLGLDPERKRIVFCARLIDVKRADLAIDAFAQFAHRRPSWDLVIIGDGPLRDWLRWRVPTDLRHRVIWTGFISDQQTVGAIYRACDVMVLPSDYEPWALVVNEALAAGLALVVSSVVGAGAELVRDGVNGRVFPPSDRDALAAALLDATTPDRLEAMRLAAPRVLEEWRRSADPVQAVRAALQRAGVLT